MYAHIQYYLHYAYGLNFPFTTPSLPSEQGREWHEWGMQVMLAYCLHIIRRQPHLRYEEIREESPFLRGKLLIREYFTKKFSKGKFQEFPHQQAHFVFDNTFNRLVKFTAWDICQKGYSPEIHQRAEEIYTLLSAVRLESIHWEEIDQLFDQCIQAEEKLVISFCQMYWQGLVLDSGGSTKPNFAFLLPMERVFEKFIGSFIQEHFPHLDPQEQAQLSLGTIKEQAQPAFRLRQDIYLPKENMVIEIKYKIKNQGKRPGVENPDFYQILSYGLAQSSEQLLLLYPALSNSKNNAASEVITVKSGLLKNQEITVRVFDLLVYLNKWQDLKSELDTSIIQQLRTVLPNY
ncbi:MAG: hypothetical protein AAFU64_11885 [Bacteroidota bacterium]